MTRLTLPLLVLLAAARLEAQASVVGERDLAFGAVIRGVQTSVEPTDPVRSGRFRVTYLRNRQVRVNLTLPRQLDRVAGGASMPINFRGGDAIARGTDAASLPVTFNPNAPITFSLLTSPDFIVSLGGRVSPRANQATGVYRGTVVLTCTFF
jgi:hypothetical protein